LTNFVGYLLWTAWLFLATSLLFEARRDRAVPSPVHTAEPLPTTARRRGIIRT
jgi:hypothetical protein